MRYASPGRQRPLRVVADWISEKKDESPSCQAAG